MKELNSFSIVGNTRSIGLIGGIELVQNKKDKKYFEKNVGISASVVNHAQKNGLIVRALQGDIIAVCPPLIIKNNEIKL